MVLVGAGSAGSVVASRLSENGNYSVLLLEAGGYPPLFMDIPLFSASLQLTPMNWDYRTEPQKRGFGATHENVSLKWNFFCGRDRGSCAIFFIICAINLFQSRTC